MPSEEQEKRPAAQPAAEGSLPEQVLALTRFMLQKHYHENDPEALIPLLDQDLIWLGAGEEEWAQSGAAVAEIFRRFAGQVPRCNLSDEELRVLPLGPDVWLCSGRVWVSTDPSTGIALRVHQRVSFIFRRRGEKLLCCHIHVSNPYQEMKKGDAGFPVQLAQQSYQYMQEQLLAQQKKMAAQTALLERLSWEDTLSGVYNRNRFNLTVQELPEEFPQRGVACFDLNGLKETNDRQGHRKGDELIRRAAAQLRQVFDKKVYRTGGDEFVVLDLEQDEAQFLEEVARAQRLMEENGISCSVGASWHSGRYSFKEQYDEADRQMYRQKSQFYSMQEHDRRRR